MEHLRRVMEIHSSTVLIINDDAKRHRHTATGSAELLPALWQFAKAHRGRRQKNYNPNNIDMASSSSSSSSSPDRRWEAQETQLYRSPKNSSTTTTTTIRTIQQTLPTPPLCHSPSCHYKSSITLTIMSPTTAVVSPSLQNEEDNDPTMDQRFCASPKRPERQPSASLMTNNTTNNIVDRSPRKPERRKLSPPIGTTTTTTTTTTTLMEESKWTAKPSPDSILMVPPPHTTNPNMTSPLIRRRNPILPISTTTYSPRINHQHYHNIFHHDTPSVTNTSMKKSIQRESLTKAVDFFALDTDSSDEDGAGSFEDEEEEDDDNDDTIMTTASSTSILRLPRIHVL